MEENKKGLWSEEEDKMLREYIKVHGHGHWNTIAKKSGLKRCGKSCRLRWMNHLSPGVNRDNFTDEEVDLILRLYTLLGNRLRICEQLIQFTVYILYRWALIAGRVPGRTDNQVKNYWNTHLSKKLGIVTKKTKRAGPRSEAESSRETTRQEINKATQIMDSGSSCVGIGDDEAAETKLNECTSDVAQVTTLQNTEGSCGDRQDASWMNGYNKLISTGLPGFMGFSDDNLVELEWDDLCALESLNQG